MPLHVKREDVPRRTTVQSGAAGEGSMVVTKAYGNECSLMIAARKPGYHTKPHVHESEQINHIMDGKSGFSSKARVPLQKRETFREFPRTKSIGHGIALIKTRSSQRLIRPR